MQKLSALLLVVATLSILPACRKQQPRNIVVTTETHKRVSGPAGLEKEMGGELIVDKSFDTVQ